MSCSVPPRILSLHSPPSPTPPPAPRCDVDIRKDLYAGVVLTGGTAGFAALRDRLEKEVADLAPQMAKVKVRRGAGWGWGFQRSAAGPRLQNSAACSHCKEPTAVCEIPTPPLDCRL